MLSKRKKKVRVCLDTFNSLPYVIGINLQIFRNAPVKLVDDGGIEGGIDPVRAIKGLPLIKRGRRRPNVNRSNLNKALVLDPNLSQRRRNRTV